MVGKSFEKNSHPSDGGNLWRKLGGNLAEKYKSRSVFCYILPVALSEIFECSIPSIAICRCPLHTGRYYFAWPMIAPSRSYSPVTVLRLGDPYVRHALVATSFPHRPASLASVTVYNSATPAFLPPSFRAATTPRNDMINMLDVCKLQFAINHGIILKCNINTNL